MSEHLKHLCYINVFKIKSITIIEIPIKLLLLINQERIKFMSIFSYSLDSLYWESAFFKYVNKILEIIVKTDISVFLQLLRALNISLFSLVNVIYSYFSV